MVLWGSQSTRFSPRTGTALLLPHSLGKTQMESTLKGEDHMGHEDQGTFMGAWVSGVTKVIDPPQEISWAMRMYFQ